MLHCMSPLLAQSGHRSPTDPCPLLGVKRTSIRRAEVAAVKPKRANMWKNLSVCIIISFSQEIVSRSSGGFFVYLTWTSGGGFGLLPRGAVKPQIWIDGRAFDKIRPASFETCV